MTLRFDLRYSLDKQLDNAKILLQERVSILDYLQPDYPYHEWEKKRGAIGIQIRNLPMYLRVYDGRKAGDKFDQIGEELYRNEIENPDPDLALDQKNAEKRARDAFKNAIKLIEGGYKELMNKYNKTSPLRVSLQTLISYSAIICTSTQTRGAKCRQHQTSFNQSKKSHWPQYQLNRPLFTLTADLKRSESGL